MSEFEKLFFEEQQAFRNWLETHHNQSSGIWMVFFKKHTGMEGISYQEALEEALCFGWITRAKREETIKKRIGEAISLLKENKRLGMK
jgi:uncharacterized protein YdeI (YjbR/CyaY-like superfamily)